ncbi:MAG: isoleucine--tRNA ligase [Candidatus Omnitrophota bacterium]|nr:MAG: isoleucine--tRNA ligase [Candidatus Omnitrophota bacterium]
MADYSNTILLPKTDFPMRGNLSKREPEFLKIWEERDIYHKILEKNKGRPLFILHDGPPYANGHIHLGTALNKILKDMVIKYKSFRGFFAPFIPGWDCHGMPIEHQIFQQLKVEKSKVDILDFRKKASDFARKFANIQKEEFKRLGVFADWERPYLTMSPEYEAEIVKTFGKLAIKKYIYQAYKPIYWCIECETALAEAEIEYKDVVSPSIYVKFPVKSGLPEDISFLIWTTTPWTLPGNTAIAINPDFEYSLVESKEGKFIVASKLVEEILGKKKIKGKVLKNFAGKELEGVVCLNPVIERDSIVVLAEYVVLEEGTGCVHIAPGHGEEDYYTGLKYNLPVISPVDEKGRFTDEVSEWKGLNVFEANKLIIEKLRKEGKLYHQEDILHSYPCCWRCKKPVIFRSTKQWFLKIEHENLRETLKKEIENTKWIPSEGKNRILSMVEVRPDWCLSRQRLWGVPLPIFYCKGCKKPIITEETIEKVEKLVRENGSDIWFEKDVKELLPSGFSCPYCGGKDFEKEKDILDVWFDSGVSHIAVAKKYLKWPVDLYLEGSDQHRGWFQVSLIISCGLYKKAPFKEVLTHGFVVDSEGKKMSKSLGNVITPDEIIKNYGAEILRVWVASENYRQDIRISHEILKFLIKSYRNIRNTIRFLLGNLFDFSPSQKVGKDKLFEVDIFALEKLYEVINKVTEYYDDYLFYKVYETIHNFCNIFLSSFYLDYLKDRLYTYPKDSLERKSAQTVLYEILTSLLKITSPLLSFTAEEAYQFIPWEKKESIFLEDWPEIKKPDERILERWEKFLKFRKIVMKKLEEKRIEKLIGSNMEAKVKVEADEEWYDFLKSFDNISSLLIVSEVEIDKGEKGIEVKVEKTDYKKCMRCWIYHKSVGADKEYPDLCEKCIKVIKNLGGENG